MLTLVYVAFAVHVVHWWVTGSTLTPVEPSEGMQTLEQGLLNAGFVLFGLAILSTLVLGRWFCGWLCHIVALQDLCSWLLKRLRIRPKPFRSRLLAWVPLLAGLYMFVWPTVRRIWLGEPAPTLVPHFTTEDFWATFPGLWISLLTFGVCGFLVVWVLGNKGFCMYACPYGGLFGVADRLAPGKIRVTDACDGCGHCTAACSSNVRVHEQVRDYGMVVDPGCMKCTDCISVCPKDALYFGFGAPSVVARPLTRGQTRRPAYRWAEEIALAGLFLILLYAFRGLYDAIPFLLALGLSAIGAFVSLLAFQILYVPSLRLQRLQLRYKGKLTRGGRAYLTGVALFSVFVGHSVLVQYHTHASERLLDDALRTQSMDVVGGEAAAANAATRALGHLEWLRRYGLFATARTEARLGSLQLYFGRLDAAGPHLRRAMELAPRYAAARHKWAELLARQGDMDSAIDELLRAVDDDPSLVDLRRDLVAALRRAARLPEAVEVLERVVRQRPHDHFTRLEWALLLAETGASERGIEELRRVVACAPGFAEAHFRLGLLLAMQHGEEDQALIHLDRARELEPLNADVLRAGALLLARLGRLSATLAEAEDGDPNDVAARYRLAFLRLAGGDRAGAHAAFEQAQALSPSLVKP